MASLIIVFLAALAIIAGLLFYPAWRERRILSRPFPDHWRAILERRLPFYRRMSTEERAQLRRLVQLFLARKRFYGCDGLAIDDEVRVTIAAQACMLLLGRPAGLYPRLGHILVYPSGFLTGHGEVLEDGTVTEEEEERLGESWESGKVILSWDDVIHGSADFSDGYNVVLHEFAHQLDGESGEMNGTPPLRNNRREDWARVLASGLDSLMAEYEQDYPGVMDHYGATSPAEFFAVATETFFEKPYEMARQYPALFRELLRFYQVDPRRWHRRRNSEAWP